MEPFILWTKQHFPLLHEILFHGEWWPSEAGAAYISLTITVYLVIKQLKLARTQNDIQAAMHALSLKQTELQESAQTQQQKSDEWHQFSIETTLFEKLHADVIQADKAFQWKYLLIYDPFGNPYEDECGFYRYDVDEDDPKFNPTSKQRSDKIQKKIRNLRQELTVNLLVRLDRLAAFIQVGAITDSRLKALFDADISRLCGYHALMRFRVTNIYYKHWQEYAESLGHKTEWS